MIWWELHLSLFINYFGVRVSHFWRASTCYVAHGRKAKPAALCVLTELIPSSECTPLRPKLWWALSIVLSVWHRPINKRWSNKILLFLWVCVSCICCSFSLNLVFGNTEFQLNPEIGKRDKPTTTVIIAENKVRVLKAQKN